MKIRFEILTLLIGWIAFGVWEYFVSQWSEEIVGPMIRVDLIIILPGLIFLTIWVLLKLTKVEKL